MRQMCYESVKMLARRGGAGQPIKNGGHTIYQMRPPEKT